MSDTDGRPNLVLIHGWGLGHTAWQPLLPVLTQRFRVQLFTCPGYGMPEHGMDRQPPDAYVGEAHEQTAFKPALCRTPVDGFSSASSATMPSFIQTAQMLARSLPDDCILCGWSLGSLLALQTASMAPQRIRKLILVGGTPSFTQRTDWPHAQPSALLDTFINAVTQDAAGTLQRFIALLNQGDTQARLIGRAMVKQLLAAQLPATATLLTGLGWLRDVDLRERIASITIPTLLIHGENDQLMPLLAAQWLNEKLSDSRLDVFPGAAHAPFLNDPERFAKLIGDH